MLGENACSGKTRIIIRSVSVSLTQLDASMLSVERSHLPHSECHVCVLWSFQRLVDDYCLLHPKHAQLVDDHSTLWYMKDQSSSEGRGGGGGRISWGFQCEVRDTHSRGEYSTGGCSDFPMGRR